jgi:DHA2 family multidrug resistance protein
MRNLGGSIGIAGLSTMLARRETYHFSMIGDAVTRNDPGVAAWLAEVGQRFAVLGTGPVEQQMKALGQLAGLVRREAFIMAYGDCFFVIGVGLILSLPAVLLLKRPPAAHAPPSGDAH